MIIISFRIRYLCTFISRFLFTDRQVEHSIHFGVVGTMPFWTTNCILEMYVHI